MGAMTAIAVGGMVASATVSAIQMKKAKDEARDANTRKGILKGEMANLENNRQQLVNPYAGVTNQYANLGVATKAAEMQIDETDKALANTLDMLRLSGGSAGGATALAQAALKSKLNVAASIETQEAQNEKLRAQGQMQVDQMKAQGQFQVMGMQETRELQKLDRTQSMIDQESLMEAEGNQAYYGAMGNMASAFGTGTGNIMTGLEADNG